MNGVSATGGTIVSVSRDARHGFSKPVVPEIVLLGGLGIEGDAHCGATSCERTPRASTSARCT